MVSKPWKLQFGMHGAQPILMIMAGTELVFHTQDSNPALFNHIVYIHNKELERNAQKT